MEQGRRYIENDGRKLNIVKVILVIVLIAVAIFGIYKLISSRNNDNKNKEIPKELGREIGNDIKNTEVKNDNKTIEDYMKEYSAVLIEKIKDDTYYVSVDGKECTLYTDGTLVDGKIAIWNGESKELSIDKDTTTIGINTPEEFKWFADQIISGEKNFSGITLVLNNNIDLGGRIIKDSNIEGTRWNSIIGTLKEETNNENTNVVNTTEDSNLTQNNENSDEEQIKGFAGVFDGNNHWIKGMIIESGDKYQGLFGYLNGTVRNLIIKDSSISGSEGVGAFVGLNAGKIENCKMINTTVTGKEKIGGFVGIGMTDSVIDGCIAEKNSSKIIGNNNIGGIVGYLNNNSKISNCENRSSITGSDYVGGIIGISFFGTDISNCSSIEGSIEGNDYVGGIIGYSQSQVEKCFNKSKVSGSSYIGGLVGLNYTMGNISSSFNYGEVSAEKDFIGGITGVNTATIVSTYNVGDITSKNTEQDVSIGGISGQNLSEGAVNNSYNVGIITGKGSIGGVIGANFGITTNCYYLDSTTDVKTDEAKTEEEMKSLQLDEDFKDDINNINKGYIILNWQ